MTAEPIGNPHAPAGARRHKAALGDGDRELHAAAAEADDVANEVARARARERDDGPAAGVVAQLRRCRSRCSRHS